jgi:geranylgeranyl pyrophosphate synthase
MKDRKLSNSLKSKMFDTITEGMIKLAFGQATDIYWHNGKKEKITEKQYLQMCSYKTGTLASVSARLGALLGNASKDQINTLGNFAESLGVAFQIQDDILNVTNRNWGKQFGDDISEGKRSLILIKVLEKGSRKDRRRIMEIVSMKTRNRTLIEEAVSIMKKYDAIDYAGKKAKKITKDAWKKLDSVLPGSTHKNMLKMFADFIIKKDI